MALTPGTTLGSFEISGLLGVGGMGEVYRARDTKLGRDVAIKVLPDAFAHDKDRLARFEREARLLAALDHPNIASIYELQEDGGVRFLVMQLVEGSTLAERIAAGPISIADALPLFAQIAEALEAAHEHGIVHRDLKPANIKVTEDGQVKVLDFGLAKAMASEATSSDPSESPTLLSSGTGPGMIAGTIPYMSPEQARGKPVDRRTDVWAFGCCLYEALTGERPFRGETASDIAAKILETDPDWGALPTTTPANIRLLIERCLRKDLRRRLRDMGDVSIEINDTQSLAASASSHDSDSSESAGGARVGPYILALVLGVAAIGVAALLSRPATTNQDDNPRPVSRLSITLPPEHRIYTRYARVAISPDGRKLVIVAQRGSKFYLILRHLDQSEAIRVAGSDGAREPFFSPDGEWIGYWAAERLWKLRLAGGSPVPICEATSFAGASWGAGDTIFFCPAWGQGIWRVNSDGSGLEELTQPDHEAGEYGHWNPRVLPGGETVLFDVWKGDVNSFQVDALSLQSGRRHRLIQGGSYAVPTSSGNLIYAQGDSLFAVSFDEGRLEVGKDHRRVLEGLQQHTWSGSTPYDIANNGTLVYVPGRGVWDTTRQIMWIGRRGGESPVEGLQAGSFSAVQLSPDQSRLAVSFLDGGLDKIAIYDLTTLRLMELGLKGINFGPLWRPPAGKQIAFTTSPRGSGFSTVWMRVDKSSPPESLTHNPDQDIEAVAWSPDGKYLMLVESMSDLKLLSLDPPRETRDFEAAPAIAERNASFSPDGGWVAFSSDLEGRWEVYARPFEGGGPRIKISDGGGHSPLWSKEGGEIFYHDEESVMSVAVDIEGDRLRPGRPEELFRGRFIADARFHGTYDYDPTTQRFLLVKAGEDEVATNQVNVALNWAQQVDRLLDNSQDGAP